MTASLRRDLLSRLIRSTLALTLCGGVVTYVLALRFADETYDQWLLDSARSLAQQVEVEDGAVRLDLPAPALQLLVWDAYDKVIFRVDSSRSGFMAGNGTLPVAAPPGDAPITFYDTQDDNKPMRAVRVLLPNVVPGEDITVTIAETLKKRRLLAGRVLLAVLVPELLLIVLSVLLVRSGVRRGLQPIDKLEAAVHGKSPADLTPLPDADAPAELRPFTEAINGLLGRLDLVLDAQRRFIADTAHQLRTPLASLKLELEQARRDNDPAAHAQSLERLRVGIDRIARLSNQLLLLARAEPGAMPTTRFTPIDLRRAAFDAAADWVPRALASDADLGFEGETEGALIMGDPLLIAEAVNNLVDNALHYAGRSPHVTLRIEEDVPGGRYCLVVEDDGPGIADTNEREAVLRRFHRAPGSPGNGSGLGLAIVAEIAAAHRGELSLETAGTHGLRVRLYFPMAA